ncbi:MAG: glycosyltransferase family 39 protein [bacterium]|nr:glycosyltransferase family 39 protein [bacterium]
MVALPILACVPMFWGLGRWPLLDPDEGRNAEVAREMLGFGSWMVPRLNGLPFLDKPPMLFWIIAGAFRAFGTNEISARLPAALAGVALVLLTVALTRMLLGRLAACWAGVALATAPLALVYARLTIFDMPFTAFVTAALVSLVRTRLGGAAAVWLPLAGLSMGLAVLTKGPVGVVLPLLAWWCGRGALPPPVQRSRRIVVLAASALTLTVVLPWLLWVVHAEPDFLRYAVVDETLLRFTSTARFHRGEPVYYPTAVAVVGMGVWASVLLWTAPMLMRDGGTTPCQRSAIHFAARAAVAILVFFSISASKRAGYVLPALVPLALLVGAGITLAPERALSALRGAAVIALFVALLSLVGQQDATALADFPKEAPPTLVQPLFLITCGVCIVWGAAVLAAGRRRPALALAAVFAPALYLLALDPLMPFAESRSARRLASALPPNATVVGLRHFRPSLAFYHRRTMLLATFDGRELTSNYVSSRPERFLADGRLVTPAHARQLIRATPSFYVLTGAGRVTQTPRWNLPLVVMATDQRSALWATR